MAKIKLNLPFAQIEFARALKEIRSLCLQDALTSTVASIRIEEIDQQLHSFVGNEFLRMLAARGMRGELIFSIPVIISANPRLLGYYRLLLGYSQKEFYNAATGVGVFRSLEHRGVISPRQLNILPDLCGALNLGAKYMLEHFDAEFISPSFFDQLTLLTLGPQLRGGANVQRGSAAILQVFNLIVQIVRPAIIHVDQRCIELRNKSGRIVYIQFAADPDIVIREELAEDIYRNLVAIEIKGGQDYSNIHNRVGEAEKSHQKAKKDGYVECWTVVNVDRIDMGMAKKESPTTNRFYRISGLADDSSSEYRDFSLQILSIVGI